MFPPAHAYCNSPPPSLPCVGGATDCSSVDFVCQVQPPANPSTLVTQTSTRTIASTPTPPCFPPSLVLAPWWRGLRPTTAFWHDDCRAVSRVGFVRTAIPRAQFLRPLLLLLLLPFCNTLRKTHPNVAVNLICSTANLAPKRISSTLAATSRFHSKPRKPRRSLQPSKPFCRRNVRSAPSFLA